ncbi:ABC transporter ATP-binding protein [Cobetia amphilecti]|uniref:ATP-binding cassette domain-containing protein n=1 Tax=Cobetia amphilecti TaxID=1055104 RepID=A0AAP4WYE5_9GAMM|nr:ATP-binding cassette domain-containing protein [Cobetia amphilecti]MDO6672054.1 ATP-binding cassette domain-containing protein [Cobetia amphilecti]
MFPPSSSSSSVPPGDPSCPVAGTGFAQAAPSATQVLPADASVAPLLRVRGLEYRLPPAAQASGEGVEAQGRLLWHVAALDWAPTPASGWVHLKGDNGSGKTTLLRVLAGMQPATGGKLEWQTRDAHPVRYLHQQPYLFDTSVAGNLVLAARWQPDSGSAGQQRDQVEEMLHWSGLSDQARQPARSLSGGERARLALARAWLSRPPVLLLDEPAANLDQAAVEQLALRLEQMCQQGCAVILSSHQDNALSQGSSARWTLSAASLHTEPTAD